MALFVPLLEVWILEAQCGVNLREKSFPHIEKLMPGSEKLFITRSFFSEGQGSTLSIPGKLVHPIFRTQ